MREILFRGKRTDNGEWVCSGNLIHFNEGNECYIPVKNSNCTCTHDINDNIIEWNEVMFCKVIPNTVGQYTGLIDKNYKRIFEGDIIKIPDDYDTYGTNAGEVYEVYFVFGGFRLKPKYRKNARGYFLEDSGEVEVIGSIHDNPELIAEVQDVPQD